MTTRFLTVLLVVPIVLGAVPKYTLSGTWEWTEHRRGPKPQLAFSIDVHTSKAKVWGTYSLATAIDGTWQVEDGNQTPFLGKLTNGVAKVEFDPAATVPGYEEHVTYKPPSSGNPP